MTVLMPVKRSLINKIQKCLQFSVSVYRGAVPRSAILPVHHSFLDTILRTYRRLNLSRRCSLNWRRYCHLIFFLFPWSTPSRKSMGLPRKIDVCPTGVTFYRFRRWIFHLWNLTDLSKKRIPRICLHSIIFASFYMSTTPCLHDNSPVHWLLFSSSPQTESCPVYLNITPRRECL